MLDRTSFMAWLNARTGRFCAAMAEVNASMHGAVVADRGAGHVQAGDGDAGHRNVSSAMAGAQVMPRPPGPVTSTTPGSGSDRW